MQILEKIFKNRFKNKQSLEGIDADELWGSIAESMDSVPASSTKNISKWIFVLLYIAFSGLLFLYLTDSNTKKEQQQITKTEAIVSSKGNKLKNTSQEETEVCEDNQRSSVSEVNTSTSKIAIATKGNTENTAKKQNNIIETPELYTATSISIKKEKNIADLPNIATFMANTEKENAKLTTAPKVDIQHKRIEINDVETLALRVAYTSKNEVNLTKKPLFSIQAAIKPFKKWPLEVFLGVGTNVVFTQYKGNTNPTAIAKEVKDATNYYTGFSSTLKVTYLINDKYSISSGLNYDLTQTIFKRSGVKKSTRLETHYLLSYQLNPTGDIINKMYGDKVLNTLETQKVVHRNQFKQISIPLAFGVRKKVGKAGLGLDLGISYNYFLSQKGKSIDAEQEFYAFNDKISSTRPFKTAFFAFQLNPFLDMQMTEKLKFRLSATLKYEPQGISNLYQVNQYTIFTGFSGGVVFVL